MGAKLGGDDDEAIVDINITPFVDIILVVLIIFMVTATYIMEQSIKVKLPDAATGEPTEESSFAITMDAEKSLFLDGEPITEEALRKALQAAKKESEQKKETGEKHDVKCLISADHTVSHGDFVGIIDLIRQEGINKYFINIDPQKGTKKEASDEEIQ